MDRERWTTSENMKDFYDFLEGERSGVCQTLEWTRATAASPDHTDQCETSKADGTCFQRQQGPPRLRNLQRGHPTPTTITIPPRPTQDVTVPRAQQCCRLRLYCRGGG
eukprot:2477754-Rhodomonas_salina.1